MNNSNDVDTIIYEDSTMKLTNKVLTLYLYWFPFGTAKHIRLDKIKSIKTYYPRSVFGIKGWGMVR